jgi:hypothetical protein
MFLAPLEPSSFIPYLHQTKGNFRMSIRRRDVLKVATSSAAAAVATKLMGRSALASEAKRIVRDVCVIGGGSAGTYAAVQLRNLGKSVAVLEKENHLGGHAETVYVGNVPIDIGVQVFEGQSPLVTSYCAQLGVPLFNIPLTGGPPAANVDFRTGTPVNVPPSDPVAVGTAIGTYLQILQTEFPYLDSGFNLPNPVPPDLLLSYGDFSTKYGLDALLPSAFEFAAGAGDILSNPALYILKLFGLSVVGAIATSSFVIIPGGTQTLYNAAAAFLGSDAIVSAQIVAVARFNDKVEVLALTPNGPVLIEAGKLVFAIPPTLQNLAMLAPDPVETSLFSRFQATYYSTSLVQFSGLPPGVSVNNAAANTRANLPPLPGVYGLQATPVPGYYAAMYGATSWLPDAVVKGAITSSLDNVANSGIYPGMTFDSLDIFTSHAPFHMTVSTQDIRAGFYSKVNALQGHKNTFYTGAAFQTNDSSQIWRFTSELLPQIVA